MTDLMEVLTAFQITDHSRADLWTWSGVWIFAQRDRLLYEMAKCWSLLVLYVCLSFAL